MRTVEERLLREVNEEYARLKGVPGLEIRSDQIRALLTVLLDHFEDRLREVYWNEGY